MWPRTCYHLQQEPRTEWIRITSDTLSQHYAFAYAVFSTENASSIPNCSSLKARFKCDLFQEVLFLSLHSDPYNKEISPGAPAFSPFPATCQLCGSLSSLPCASLLLLSLGDRAAAMPCVPGCSANRVWTQQVSGGTRTNCLNEKRLIHVKVV